VARYLEIEDLAANAFIEVLQSNPARRFISYIDLQWYGERVADVLNQNAEGGKHCILLLDRDRTYAMLEYYSDFFVESECDGVKGLYLRDKRTADDLRDKFRGYLPLDVLLAFVSPKTVAPLLTP